MSVLNSQFIPPSPSPPCVYTSILYVWVSTLALQLGSSALMLKLKLQYFDHLLQRADSLEKTLILGKIEGKRRRGLWKRRWLDSITDLMDMSLSKLRL